jgi:outer membrane protein assembly factor BamB
VESRTTTTSCSALALIVTCAAVITLEGAPAKKPFSPFPSRTHWSLSLNNNLAAQPAFDGDSGYFPIEGDRIAAYDLTHGTLLWVVPAATRSAPAVGGGLLFLEPGETIAARQRNDGSLAWEIPLAEKLAAPLVFANGWLFAATSDALLAYRASDGSLLWRRDIAGVRTSPAVAGDRLYLSLADGRVLALRVDDGVQVWAGKIGGMPNEILALDTQLFVGSTDNHLYCLKTVNGEFAWRKQTGADVLSRPVADENNVYFVSLDNVLRALNRGHGVQQWMRALPFRPAWAPIGALDAVVVAGLAVPPRAYFFKDGTPADALTTDKTGEIVAPLHTFTSPMGFGPVIVLVTRSLSGEVSVTATSRAIEPPPASGIGPLPNVTPVVAPKL